MRWAGLIAASTCVICVCCHAVIEPPPPRRPPTAPASATPRTAPPPNPQSTATTPDAIPEAHQGKLAALALDARGAIEAFANREGEWSPDRRRLLLISNRHGPWRGYETHWRDLDQPPVAFAGLPPLEAATFTRDGESLLLLASTGEGPRELRSFDITTGTVGELGGIQGEPSLPLVASRSRSIVATIAQLDGANTVYVATLGTDTPAKAVAREAADSRLADVSPDGDRLLVVRPSREPADSLVELDAKSGNARDVLPKGYPHRVIDAAYAAEGHAVVLAARSLEGIDHVQRLATKTPTPRVTNIVDLPAGIRVIRLLASPRGSATALELDAGDRTEIRLVYPGGYRRARTVPMPMGTGHLGRFSRDGNVLTLTWETPSGPPDLFEIDASRGTVRVLRHDARATLARLDEVVALERALASGDPPGERVHVFLPASVADGQSVARRVVVLADDRARRRYAWRPVVRFLVGHGYAVVEPAGEVTKESLAAIGQWAAQQAWGSSVPRVLVGLRSGEEVVRTVARAGVDDWEAMCLMLGWAPSGDGSAADTPMAEGSTRWFVGHAGRDPARPREASDALVRTLRDRRVPVHYAVTSSEADAAEAQAMLLARLTWFLDGHCDQEP